MAVIVEDPSTLSVEPLSESELAWAKKMDALLKQMPPRLKLVEVDDDVCIVDSNLLMAIEGGFGVLRDAGGVLASLSSGVMKVSGMTH